MTRAGKLKPIIIAALAALMVAMVGGLMTDIGPWYLGLAKPAWQPPDWLFGPAWTLIFSLAAASGVIAWRNAPDQASREWMLALFALNGFLNVFWMVTNSRRTYAKQKKRTRAPDIQLSFL